MESLVPPKKPPLATLLTLVPANSQILSNLNPCISDVVSYGNVINVNLWVSFGNLSITLSWVK